MSEEKTSEKPVSKEKTVPRNKAAGTDVENLADISRDKNEWGEIPDNNFGYASDEERRAKRGLEDWELVDSIPESQERVPPWFFAVVVAVLLVAIGLSFPFWGERPGYEKENWLDWGFALAIVYLLVFGTFVYFMVNFYGSKHAGRLDSDKENTETQNKMKNTDKSESYKSSNNNTDNNASNADNNSNNT